MNRDIPLLLFSSIRQVCLAALMTGPSILTLAQDTPTTTFENAEQPDQAEAASQPEQPDVNAAPAEDAGEQTLSQVIELASALRLKSELDAMLTAEGRAAPSAADGEDNPLAGLATRCALLANSAQSLQARAILLDCQARANAALAQVEADASSQTYQRRLQQLRSAAEKLRQLEVPIAQPSADYWLLLADLADTAQLSAGIASRQALAEELLSAYLEAYRDNELAREYVIDARLSLAQLMDQRGDQAQALAQLEAIGDLPADSPRKTEIDRLTASAQRVGKSIDIEGVTTQLKVWRLSQHAGHPVLIHIYADAVEPSVAMIDSITQAIAQESLGGCTIVSLRVGEPVSGARLAPWPTLPIGLEEGGVLDQLGIDALPTLVWIDAQGKVASIGHTTRVLDQVPQAPRDEASQPESQPESQLESGPDKPSTGEGNTQAPAGDAEPPTDAPK